MRVAHTLLLMSVLAISAQKTRAQNPSIFPESLKSFRLSEPEQTIDMIHKKGLHALGDLIQSVGGQCVDQPWGMMVRANPKHSNMGFNFALVTTRLTPHELESVLKDIQTFFKDIPYQVWMDDMNQSLTHDMEQRHFSKRVYPAKYIDLKKNVPFYNVIKNLTIKPVTDRQGGHDWAHVTARVYKLDEKKLFDFFTDSASLPQVRFHVAYLNGKPASARMTITFDGAATGYFSATLPEFRKKGIASSLMRGTFQALHKEGITLFVNKAAMGPSGIWKKVGLNEYGNNYRCFVKK